MSRYGSRYATPAPPGPTVPVVLDFTEGAYVACGDFWPTAVDLPQFYWETWARMDELGSGYWASEGYGGSHAILAGMSGTGKPTGEIYDGATSTSPAVAPDYVLEAGEWAHLGMGWDGTTWYFTVNGIVVGATAFAGPRRAQQGTLFIGGSDHSNWPGKIAMVRGFEAGTFPHLGGAATHAFDRTFKPERPFGYANRALTTERAAFLMDFGHRSNLIPDLSEGYGGRFHPGRLTAGAVSAIGPDTRPAPLHVYDPGCPVQETQIVLPTRALPTAPATPGSAKIFDSFSRAPALYAFTDTPALGSTETGSLGALAWVPSHTDAFGILDGRAVQQKTGTTFATAHVEVGTADMDVRVDRRVIDGLHNTGICFRKQDTNNYWRARTTGAIGAASIVLQQTTANAAGTTVATYACPATWTTLRVVCSAGTVTVYTDDGAGGWTQIGQLTAQTFLDTATKAGLANYTPISTAWRYDNFTVL